MARVREAQMKEIAKRAVQGILNGELQPYSVDVFAVIGVPKAPGNGEFGVITARSPERTSR